MTSISSAAKVAELSPLSLLRLAWAAPARRSFSASSGAERVRLAAFFLGSAFFVVTLYSIFRPVTAYLWDQEELGPMLSARVVTIVFGLLFVLLFLSSLLAFLSRIFFAADAPLFLATPLSPKVYFEFRLWQTLLGTAWMILPVWLPYLWALRRAMKASWALVVWGLLAPWPLAALACGLSAATACAVTRVLPPRLLRRGLLFAAVVLGLAALWLLRSARPERLADPESAQTITNYLANLNALEPWWWPPSWASRAVMRFGGAPAQAIAWWGLGLGMAAFVWRMTVGVFGPRAFGLWLQFGQGNTQGSKAKIGRAFSGLGGRAPWRWLLEKEALALWRAPAQRLQALFLASLVGLFVFNLSRLPLGDDADLKQYLFIPTCAFAQLILISVGARFVFPAGSLELPGSWLIFSAPMPSRELLKAKLALFGGILSALSLTLAWAVWKVFQPQGVALAGGLAGFVTAPWILASMNLGLGIAWARSDAGGPDEVISSPAGVLVMVLGSFYILGHALLMAVPMYEAGRAQYLAHYEPNKAALALCLLFWLALQGVAFVWPLVAATRKIEGRI
jgi:uncharacterized BrkB/YihY/UPF0761 family membrane protein